MRAERGLKASGVMLGAQCPFDQGGQAGDVIAGRKDKPTEVFVIQTQWRVNTTVEWKTWGQLC